MEAYVVFDFFENPKDRNVVVLGRFDYNDTPRKHLLLRVMEDPSKSVKEVARAKEEYDSLMRKPSGYYISKGVYIPGGILERIPEDAEPIPNFEISSWEDCFGEYESEKILGKLRKLKSGVYHCFEGEMKDMVYEASERCFLDWVNKNTSFENIDGGVRRPLSVKDRYNILMAAQENGFVFGRIPEEWDDFEGKMKRVKNRGLIRKV